MSPTPQDDDRLNAAIRAAVRAVPDPEPALLANTARWARAAQAQPGEGVVSLRGLATFSQSMGVTAVVLFAGMFYAVVEAIQLASIFDGGH